MKTLVTILLGIPLVFGAIFLFSLIGAIPTYFLWNWVGVDVLGLKVVTFWQAWGLLLLAGFLTKGSSSTSKCNKD
jgi:hypothetical protein